MPNKKVWVIGGTSGIGKSTAELLQGRGVEVICTGAELPVQSYHALRTFINNEVDVYNIESDICRNIIFCAGINRLSWIKDIDYLEMDRVRDIFNVNTIGFINLMAALTENGKETTPRNVVAVSSDAGSRPLRTSIAYCASKAALDMAVRVSARELGPLGWKINAVSPGMVAGTEMTQYIDEAVPKVRGWTFEEALGYERSQEVVRGRIFPGEVAKTILDLLNAPSHMNGSIINLNGGR